MFTEIYRYVYYRYIQKLQENIYYNLNLHYYTKRCVLNVLPSEIIVFLNVTITIVDIKSIILQGLIVVTVHFTHAAASHAHSSSHNENQW